MEAVRLSEEVLQLRLFNTNMFPVQQLTSAHTMDPFYLPICFMEHFNGPKDGCAPGLILSSRIKEQAGWINEWIDG